MLKLWSKFIGRYINSINLSVIKNVPKITITSSYTFYLLDDFIILNCIEKNKMTDVYDIPPSSEPD